MLRNFFKTATRNILKYKTYSFINFVGLTTGLALALLIITYVRSELSYDQFNTKLDRLYRIKYLAPNGAGLATSPPPIAPAMKDYFSEVEETARVYRRNVSITLPDGKEAFEETRVTFVDSAFTKMFTLEWVSGNSVKALHEKFTVVLNEAMARKYFADKDPIGEELIFSGKQAFTVVGVVKDFPENSHLHFNMLVPYDDMFDIEDQATEDRLRVNLGRNFIISHSYTYVLLKPGATPDNINANMDAFIKKHASPNYQVGQIFSLMPVSDIHLMSTLQAEPSSVNSMSNIFIFLGVGLLTLIIASINYINLSTAQSLNRVKEIGIRKIMGSMRYQLVGQFLMESFLFCAISMTLAYLIFDLTLPALNLFTNKNLEFTQVVDQPLLLASAGLLLLMTALAGGYPAYFVTSFESVSALKGTRLPGEGRDLFRKALVVFQLVIACMMLSGSLLIVKQLDYLQNKPLGFRQEQIVFVPLFSQNLNGFFRPGDSTYHTRLETFRTIVEAQTGVQGTTLSSEAPGLGAIFRNTIPEGFTREDNMFVGNVAIDYDYLSVYDLKLVAGRSFSREFVTDEKEAFIINEAAVKEFNWGTPEQSLGKIIEREGKKGKVIGVINDYHFNDLTTPVSALVLGLEPAQYNTLSIKFDNTNVQRTLDALEDSWNEIFPEKAFEFNFLDQQLNDQYENYKNFGNVIQSFTGIAILISCLGVYGLVLFTVKRKVKEIGVRKVLGARVGSIVLLIYRDFALLIIIGFVLAIPVSFYLCSQWLENFVYRTTIDVWTYGLSLLMIGVIVTVTISYQAIMAAQANPVDSLRSE